MSLYPPSRPEMLHAFVYTLGYVPGYIVDYEWQDDKTQVEFNNDQYVLPNWNHFHTKTRKRVKRNVVALAVSDQDDTPNPVEDRT